MINDALKKRIDLLLKNSNIGICDAIDKVMAKRSTFERIEMFTQYEENVTIYLENLTTKQRGHND